MVGITKTFVITFSLVFANLVNPMEQHAKLHNKYLPSDNVLQSCGAQEIFLFQPQFFATKIVVIRVQNPGNIFRNVPVNHCVQVIAIIEKLQVEIHGGFSGP